MIAVFILLLFIGPGCYAGVCEKENGVGGVGNDRKSRTRWEEGGEKM